MGLSCMQKICAIGHVISLVAVCCLLVSPDWAEVRNKDTHHHRGRGPEVRVGLLSYCVALEDGEDRYKCHLIDDGPPLPTWLHLCRYMIMAAVYLMVITIIVDTIRLCRRVGSLSITQGLLTLHAAVLVTVTTAFIDSHSHLLADVVPTSPHNDSYNDGRGNNYIVPASGEPHTAGPRWLTHVGSISAAILYIVGVISLLAPKQKPKVDVMGKAYYLLSRSEGLDYEAPPRYGALQGPSENTMPAPRR